MSVKLKQRRRSDTVKHCSLIHGSSKENNDPLLTGLLDAVTTTFKSNVVADKILSVKNVMGKRKYLSLRKACKNPKIPNYVSYKVLSQKIRDIDIGTVSDINEVLSYGLDENELGEGLFRNLAEYSLRLAKFYIKANEKRIDKLKMFEHVPRKNPESLMFLYI